MYKHMRQRATVDMHDWLSGWTRCRSDWRTSFVPIHAHPALVYVWRYTMPLMAIYVPNIVNACSQFVDIIQCFFARLNSSTCRANFSAHALAARTGMCIAAANYICQWGACASAAPGRTNWNEWRPLGFTTAVCHYVHMVGSVGSYIFAPFFWLFLTLLLALSISLLDRLAARHDSRRKKMKSAVKNVSILFLNISYSVACLSITKSTIQISKRNAKKKMLRASGFSSHRKHSHAGIPLYFSIFSCATSWHCLCGFSLQNDDDWWTSTSKNWHRHSHTHTMALSD